jgi:ectoine hydroxylase-related dioxygenase (phytanoyl-CoA dioxygenase family)
LPGEGGQGLHWDTDAVTRAANALWMIDDFTDENGPTRLVPGSHKFGKRPEEGMENPKADHPGQIRTLGPAGTLMVIHAHTWHGGTLNNSANTRRLVSAFFTERGKYQGIANRKLNAASQARLSPAAQTMMDFD